MLNTEENRSSKIIQDNPLSSSTKSTSDSIHDAVKPIVYNGDT